MTITLISNKYPRKLIDYLKSEQGTVVEKIGDGIYYIKNTDIETQLIVAKELKDEEAGYLKLLQTENNNRELIKRCRIHKQYKKPAIWNNNECFNRSKSK